MPRSRKLLLTTAVVGTTCAVAGLGVFAAFTATTSNTGNSVTAGTVAISDNDLDTRMYNITAAGPGSTQSYCIRVTYNGSLPSNVHLYRSIGVTNGDKFNLVVERGSGTTAAFPGCSGFTTAGTVYSGDLQTLGTDWSTGIDARGGNPWTNGNSVDYKFTISVPDDTTPNAHTTPVSSSTHSFTWEAQNN